MPWFSVPSYESHLVYVLVRSTAQDGANGMQSGLSATTKLNQVKLTRTRTPRPRVQRYLWSGCASFHI